MFAYVLNTGRYKEEINDVINLIRILFLKKSTKEHRSNPVWLVMREIIRSFLIFLYVFGKKNF